MEEGWEKLNVDLGAAGWAREFEESPKTVVAAVARAKMDAGGEFWIDFPRNGLTMGNGSDAMGSDFRLADPVVDAFVFCGLAELELGAVEAKKEGFEVDIDAMSSSPVFVWITESRD